MAMQHWSAGTSYRNYREWTGAFHPADCKIDDMLRNYESRLPAVEINDTFCRMPRQHVLEQRAESVPAHFHLAIKASRRITHQAKLQALEAWINRARNTKANTTFASLKQEDDGAGPALAESFLACTERPTAMHAPRKRPSAKERRA